MPVFNHSLGMDTDDLERVNVWNQPKTLGQMRKRNGGTLSPQSNPPTSALPTRLEQRREDSGQQEPDGFGVDDLRPS
jgi:hypothetical protein